MINLHVIQAEYGDCFILESQSGKHSVNVLIDGGPYQTFQKHLKPALKKLLINGKLHLMVLSHIDNDHIIGLLDLLEAIKNQRERGTNELVNIEKIWHNSFADLLQFHDKPENVMSQFFSTKNSKNSMEINESLVVKGFQQGTDLARLAKLLKIPINPNFDKLVMIDDEIKSIHLNDVTLHLLGPTRRNVDKLQKEWKNWYKKKKSQTIVELVQILDRSIPNLASITFLVEIKNTKILFTGDGLGKDIVDILSKNSMLDDNDKFYVDVLKIPHHGSDRNVSPEFFNTISANYYVISANGRDDNPSLNTIRWILESGGKRKKLKKIVFTNNTPNIVKIRKEYDEKKYNYECVFLEEKGNFLTLDLLSMH